MAGNLARGGLLNRVYAQNATEATFETALALIAQADALGLGSAWLAQHHFGNESGRLPSPLLLLAAASQETQCIRLGTSVIVLPLEPVRRLAEDAAIADALSQGRLELGVGSGFDTASFAAFGADFATRAESHGERVTQLRSLLAVDDAGDDGLAGRIWEASSAAEDVAARGNRLVTAAQPGDRASAAEIIARYRAAWRDTRRAPRVMLVRAIFPGFDRQRVEAEIGPDIARYLESRGQSVSRADLPAFLERLGVVWGTPSEIVDRLSTTGALRGVDDIVAQVQTFSTTRATALRRLELFAERVLPGLSFDPHATARGAA